MCTLSDVISGQLLFGTTKWCNHYILQNDIYISCEIKKAIGYKKDKSLKMITLSIWNGKIIENSFEPPI